MWHAIWMYQMLIMPVPISSSWFISSHRISSHLILSPSHHATSEWYSWHFPELIKVVNDNYQFAQLAVLIKNKSTLTPDKLDAIDAIVQDKEKAQQVLDAAKMSMGTDLSEIDMVSMDISVMNVM